MRDVLYSVQRSMFLSMKKRALSYEMDGSGQLKKYHRNFEKHAKRPFTLSNTQQLAKSCLSSQFIYVADFHTFDQNIKNFIRLLQRALDQQQRPLVALEFIPFTGTESLWSYLKGHISELEFLDDIDYHESWKFPWVHYKKLIDFLKLHPQIQAFGINGTGSLEHRDQLSAQLLSHLYLAHPKQPIFILYGEYHLAPNKLPLLVEEYLKNHHWGAPKGPKTKYTIIHQNLDAPYWELKANAKHSIIKFNHQEFCLLTAPVWMKYESLCYWLENFVDDPDYEIHDYTIRRGLKTLSDSTLDHLMMLMQHMSKTHGLDLAQIPVFSLYDQQSWGNIESFINKNYPKAVAKFYLLQMQQQGEAILEQHHKIYLGQYSMNRLCKLAGGYLFLASQQQHRLNGSTLVTKNAVKTIFLDDFFYLYLMKSFHGQFFTKCINPYIKCPLYGDLVDITEDQAAQSKGTYRRWQIGCLQSAIKLLNGSLGVDTFLKGQSSFPLRNVEFVAKIMGELLAESYWMLIHASHLQHDQKQYLEHWWFPKPGAAQFKWLCQLLLKPGWYQLQRKNLF